LLIIIRLFKLSHLMFEFAIIGAILNNFNFEQYSEYHINCSFNISKKSEFYQWYKMWKYGYRPSQYLKFKILDQKYRSNS
ncbi:hypothetical protein RQ87_19100, partial [Acinetobacter baumannii]